MKKKAIISSIVSVAMLVGVCSCFAGCGSVTIDANTDPAKIKGEKVTEDTWNSAIRASAFDNVSCHMTVTNVYQSTIVGYADIDGKSFADMTVANASGKMSGTMKSEYKMDYTYGDGSDPETDEGENDPVTVVGEKMGEEYYQYTETPFGTYMKTPWEGMDVSGADCDVAAGVAEMATLVSFSTASYNKKEKAYKQQVTVEGATIDVSVKFVGGKLASIVAVTPYKETDYNSETVGTETQTRVYYDYGKTTVQGAPASDKVIPSYQEFKGDEVADAAAWTAVMSAAVSNYACVKYYWGITALEVAGGKLKKTAYGEETVYGKSADDWMEYKTVGDITILEAATDTVNDEYNKIATLAAAADFATGVQHNTEDNSYSFTDSADVTYSVKVKDGKIVWADTADEYGSAGSYYFCNFGTVAAIEAEASVSEAPVATDMSKVTLSNSNETIEYDGNKVKVTTIESAGYPGETMEVVTYYDWTGYTGEDGSMVKMYTQYYGDEWYMQEVEPYGDTFNYRPRANVAADDFALSNGVCVGANNYNGYTAFFKGGKLALLSNGFLTYAVSGIGTTSVTLPEVSSAE